MLFNSYIFILFFLPLTIIGYYLLNHFQKYEVSKVFLVMMSFWFYGYFNVSYLLIIIVSIVVNYGLGKGLVLTKNTVLAKVYLGMGLFFNLSLLFYFKYYDFFISNTNQLFSTEFHLKHIVLPLGISFFTFQQLSFVIDCYKKQVPLYGFWDYSLFVTFFPQLVAGPIVLHSEMVPQFADRTNKNVDYGDLVKGIYALTCGMAKKVLLADTFGMFVNYGFANHTMLNTTEMLFVMIGYTLQIYYDFSGYCDMAVGIGSLLRIKIPMNFHSPYKAVTILDFWKRWHMTLTRFFTNYVYIPLGGNRKGAIRTYGNIGIVFLISGLWHGANWTFIVWGILHGANNIVTRISGKWIEKIPKCMKWLATFLFINVTWLLFRSDSMKQCKEIYATILSLDFGGISTEMLYVMEDLAEVKFLNEMAIALVARNITLPLLLIIFAIGLFGVLCMRNTMEKIERLQLNMYLLMKVVVVAIWCLISFAGVSTFLYFDF